MKIMTWNLHKCLEAWTYLREKLKPDIAFIQEMPRQIPKLPPGECIVQGAGNPKAAIYSRNCPLEEIKYQSAYPGRGVVARVSMANGSDLFLGNIHGVEVDRHLFPHLTTIFEEVEKIVADRTAIVGGDLLTARVMKKRWPRLGHPEFWDHVDAHYVDCMWHTRHKEFRTIFEGCSTFQIDHLFITKDLLPSLAKDKCRAVKSLAILSRSDHLPVVAELTLPR